MRAKRKKRYALRRENRAREFWQREVMPAINKVQRIAFEEGVSRGRALERQDTSLLCPMKENEDFGPRADLDALEEENYARGDGGRRYMRDLRVLIRSASRPAFGFSNPIHTQEVRFERVMMGMEINGNRFRWRTWQPESRYQGDGPKSLPLDLLSAMFTFIQSLPRMSTDGYVIAAADSFVRWATAIGIEVAPFQVPSRATPGREEEHAMMQRWSGQGMWR